MSKKSKVSYQLNNLKEQMGPSEEDIKNILRAADEIIFVGGRTILAKILKGSKDKKLLDKQLELKPTSPEAQKIGNVYRNREVIIRLLIFGVY